MTMAVIQLYTDKTRYVFGWYGTCGSSTNFDLDTIKQYLVGVYQINEDETSWDLYNPTALDGVPQDFTELTYGYMYLIVFKASTGNVSVTIQDLETTNISNRSSKRISDTCEMSACEAQCTVIDDLTEQIAKISNTLATLKNSCDQTPTPVLQPTPTPKEETPTPIAQDQETPTPKEETPTPIAQDQETPTPKEETPSPTKTPECCEITFIYRIIIPNHTSNGEFRTRKFIKDANTGLTEFEDELFSSGQTNTSEWDIEDAVLINDDGVSYQPTIISKGIVTTSTDSTRKSLKVKIKVPPVGENCEFLEPTPTPTTEPTPTPTTEPTPTNKTNSNSNNRARSTPTTEPTNTYLRQKLRLVDETPTPIAQDEPTPPKDCGDEQKLAMTNALEKIIIVNLKIVRRG